MDDCTTMPRSEATVTPGLERSGDVAWEDWPAILAARCRRNWPVFPPLIGTRGVRRAA
jgi:hypothetical protein